MKFGIDLDNTLIDHGQALAQWAQSHSLKLGASSCARQAVLDYLQKTSDNPNHAWTQLQSQLYGPLLQNAPPFEDAEGALKQLAEKDTPLYIISHKSRFPALGQAYDLQDAARQWLNDNNIAGALNAVIPQKRVFLEPTLEQKITRIRELGLTHFIDDKEEVLEHPLFPEACIGILFKPQATSDPEARILGHWSELLSLLSALPAKPCKKARHYSPPGKRESPHRVLNDLIESQTGKRIVDMTPLPGGGNNRAFKLIDTDRTVFFGKEYYPDSRERLEHEFRFLEAVGSQTGLTPRPLAASHKDNIALYSFLTGTPFGHGQTPTQTHWNACLSFLDKLQNSRSSEAAQTLKPAAEAAFSLMEHQQLLQLRRDDWLELANSGQLSNDLADHIQGPMEARYQALAQDLIASPIFKQKIPQEALILSPSDFGLHNALICPKGTLQFVDFEYAGWDDPAKTLADFFCQPRFPAPDSLYQPFLEAINRWLPEEQIDPFYERLPLVRRTIELKWEYIKLAEKHPQHAKRRQFAQGALR